MIIYNFFEGRSVFSGFYFWKKFLSPLETLRGEVAIPLDKTEWDFLGSSGPSHFLHQQQQHLWGSLLDVNSQAFPQNQNQKSWACSPTVRILRNLQMILMLVNV